MSGTFAVNRDFETETDSQLSQQPTVDMGTPIDLPNAAVLLDSAGGGVALSGMPTLLCSQLQPDDSDFRDVKAEVGELKPVDSMPHLMPMVSDAFSVQRKDDTENWVPMVRQDDDCHFVV